MSFVILRESSLFCCVGLRLHCNIRIAGSHKSSNWHVTYCMLYATLSWATLPDTECGTAVWGCHIDCNSSTQSQSGTTPTRIRLQRRATATPLSRDGASFLTPWFVIKQNQSLMIQTRIWVEEVQGQCGNLRQLCLTMAWYVSIPLTKAPPGQKVSCNKHAMRTSSINPTHSLALAPSRRDFSPWAQIHLHKS